jgi:hypothetical protein
MISFWKIVHEKDVFVVDVRIIGKYLKFTFPTDESAVLYLQDFGEYIKVQMSEPPTSKVIEAQGLCFSRYGLFVIFSYSKIL